MFPVLGGSGEAPPGRQNHVCAQVVLPLVGNFPSKVPLCHGCSLRGSTEKIRQQNLMVRAIKHLQI